MRDSIAAPPVADTRIFSPASAPPHLRAQLVILGIGTALPARAIPQVDAARLGALVRGLSPEAARREQLIYRQSRVQHRHLSALSDATSERPGGFFGAPPAVGAPPAAAPHTGPTTAARMARFACDAPPLATTACERALASAGVAPARVTHLVVVTCTGFSAPGVDVALMQRLRLNPTVERVQVGFMGCHGAINGLRVAEGFAAANPAACVLLCAVELCSLHFQFGQSADAVVANALFADGAAALVAGAQPANGTTHTPGPVPAPLQGSTTLLATGSCLLPDSTDAMTWRIGDQGFAMTLGADVPLRIGRSLKAWLRGWLAGQRLSLDDIAAWAVHPGGPRILDSVRDSLNLTEHHLQPSRTQLAETGNMSSPTVLFILERLRAAGRRGPCVLLAFGPGLVAEAALLEIA